MFDWDDENEAHIRRHGIQPLEAEQVILNDPLALAVQFRSGEKRVKVVGRALSGRSS